MAIGDGLYSMLGPATSQATWIGYQIVSGIGNGLGSTIVSMLHSMEMLPCLTNHQLAHYRLPSCPASSRPIHCNGPAHLQPELWRSCIPHIR